MIRVLIIEDNPDIREDTALLLELEGYLAITASNGQQGLEEIIRHPPDIILCDWLMPGMDGLTLMNALGPTGIEKRIPFIFFSAKSERIDIKKGLESGADDYLVKPYIFEDLLFSIQDCLKL